MSLARASTITDLPILRTPEEVAQELRFSKLPSGFEYSITPDSEENVGLNVAVDPSSEATHWLLINLSMNALGLSLRVTDWELSLGLVFVNSTPSP